MLLAVFVDGSTGVIVVLVFYFFYFFNVLVEAWNYYLIWLLPTKSERQDNLSLGLPQNVIERTNLFGPATLHTLFFTLLLFFFFFFFVAPWSGGGRGELGWRGVRLFRADSNAGTHAGVFGPSVFSSFR